MCWGCVEEMGGDEVALTEELKAVGHLIRDWYDAPDVGDDGYEINGGGGGLHCQLDDFNLGDDSLDVDWAHHAVWDTERKTWGDTVPVGYSEATLQLGHRIVEALQSMTEAERSAVVWYAHEDIH